MAPSLHNSGRMLFRKYYTVQEVTVDANTIVQNKAEEEEKLVLRKRGSRKRPSSPHPPRAPPPTPPPAPPVILPSHPSTLPPPSPAIIPLAYDDGVEDTKKTSAEPTHKTSVQLVKDDVEND